MPALASCRPLASRHATACRARVRTRASRRSLLSTLLQDATQSLLVQHNLCCRKIDELEQSSEARMNWLRTAAALRRWRQTQKGSTACLAAVLALGACVLCRLGAALPAMLQRSVG